MKNRFLLIILLLLSNFIFSQSSKQIFNSPKLITEIATHKIVAILPFKGNISYKRAPKNFDPQTNKEEEIKLGRNLQSGMYTYLLRKSNDYSVTIQDVERTNVLLKQNKIYDTLDEFTPDAIAKILCVDAVIKCSYSYEKTRSEAGAIFFGGSVASGELTMNIYNGKDGELLWRFYKEMGEGVTSSADDLMASMMRKVGRNFPYHK